MSFSFSIGDFLAGAALAYNIYISDLDGSSKQYRELITSLNIVHKVFMQVEQIRISSTLAQPTLNALLFTVNSANECMVSFLTEYEKYADSLKERGSGNAITATLGKSNGICQECRRRSKISERLWTRCCCP